LPFFVIGALLVVSPGYLTPLYTEPAGKLIAAIALVMMGIGAFVITRIIDIEI
jgi:tight adherence protein B